MTVSTSYNIDNYPLAKHITDAIIQYLHSMKGVESNNLYTLILETTEEPLLDTVMQYTCGNQVKATELLGISRTTLRKKLAKYFGNKYFKIKD